MKFYEKLLTLALATTVMAGAAHAATVVQETTTTQKVIPNTKQVDFSEFDYNKDGRLSRTEVGRSLFYIFDTDGNEVIDNIEYNQPMVITIIPMKKQEITAIDFNDDGLPDEALFNEADFYKVSMLDRFDKNSDGLSAKDFLGKVIYEFDDNRDKTMDIKEFEEAYIASTTPSAANPNRYN